MLPGSRAPLAAAISFLMIASATAQAQDACSSGRAELVSVEGEIEISRSGSLVWTRATRDDGLCAGDSLRAGLSARAIVVLADGTAIRLAPGGVARWMPADDDGRSLWELLRGIIYVISHDPFELEIATPFVNAGLEGTEFLVEVAAQSATITVIEGSVSMRSDAGSVSVAAGEVGVATANAPIAITPIEDYRAALAWTRYLPNVLDLPSIDADAELPPNGSADARFFVYRAVQRWRVGRASDAEGDLAQALAIDPRDPYALAVEAIAEEMFRDPGASDVAAVDAAAAIPDPVLAELTNAIIQINRSDWNAARALLESAAERDPDDATVWARLAEALLAIGDVRGALAAADRALVLSPDNADALTMRGFARLADFDDAEAIDAFERAIVLDQASPLPHLGLGLALTNEGDRIRGRRELEIAVVLSPDDALLRSYAAKAYFDERDPVVASSQVDLAREFDMSEPTPWLYGTLVKQSMNNPIDALQDLERANALNGGQAVYRSGLLLEGDQAVRSAPLGRLYGDLGFERLALVAGFESIQGASRNHSGHRLLADTYSALPRHQLARVYELHQSQMLQPLNTTAVPPQLAEPNLFILDSAGPATLAFNEFNPLLVSNHWTVQGAATVGGNDTQGEQIMISGIQDRFSFSAGGFGFNSEGFRENNDLEMDVANAFLQFRPNAMLSFTGEVRASDLEKGDLKLLFHDDNYNPNLRQHESVDSLALGMHRLLGENGDFLASLHYRDATADGDLGGLALIGWSKGHLLDLQHLFRLDRWQLTSGANVFGEDLREQSSATMMLPVPPFVVEVTSEGFLRFEFTSAYLYGDYRPTDSITLTLGASADELRGRTGTERELNPKFGLAWTPNAGTTVRAAAFTMLQGPLLSKENIQPRLEPTEVAGFNQFYFGSEGDEVSRYAVSLDRRSSSSLTYGLELSRRDIDTSVVVAEPPPAVPYLQRIDTFENSGRAYAYWTPNALFAFSAELQRDIFDNNGIVLADGYARLETFRLPMQVRYFGANGLGAGLRVTYVDQAGDFGVDAPGPVGPETAVFFDEDGFWVVDASLTYRLRGRRGMLNLNLNNLFDQEYNFQDLDPENPRIMPERYISFGFTLAL